MGSDTMAGKSSRSAVSKLLLDSCVWGGALAELATAGHEVCRYFPTKFSTAVLIVKTPVLMLGSGTG